MNPTLKFFVAIYCCFLAATVLNRCEAERKAATVLQEDPPTPYYVEILQTKHLELYDRDPQQEVPDYVQVHRNSF